MLRIRSWFPGLVFAGGGFLLVTHAVGCGATGGGGVAGDAGAAIDATTDAAVRDAAAPSTDANLADGDATGSDASPRDPCDESSLAGVTPSPVGTAPFDLGDFRVLATDSGRFTVSDGRAPSRILWEAPPGAAPFRAYRATLAAEDRQGSFALTEGLGDRCASPVFDDVVGAGPLRVLRGRFKDTTGNCSALRFTLRLCVERRGHLTFRIGTSDPTVTAIGVRVASPPGERLWGAGEQFVHDTLNLRGRVIPIVAQEGGVGRGHQPISGAVNLVSPGSAGDEGSTYAPSSHLVTSQNRAFVLDDPEVAVFDLAAADGFELREHRKTVSGRLLLGNSLPELTERLTEFTGRMAPLPSWANDGMVVALARPIDDAKTIVDRLRARGVRIAAVWNQTWSGKVTSFVGEQVLWNWVQDPNAHPGWDAFVQWSRDRGIRTLCYVNPMLRDVPADYGPVRRNLFREARAGGHFVKRANGDDYIFPLTAFDVGLFDLSRPETRTWVKSILKDELLARAGCSGWMADFAEALPFDAVLASGEPAASFHNRYPEVWATLQREAIAEAGKTGDVLVFNRSGHTRTPGASMLLWEGDQLTTWDKYDGMTSALHGLLNAGLSGIAHVHSDVGGYTSLSRFNLGYTRERELLLRWLELSAFTTLLRTHEGNAPASNAQIYDDNELIDQAARFSKVYAALAPYRAEVAAEAQAKGWPLVRTLPFHYGDDEAVVDVDDEFLLGSALLVAPTLAKCLNPFGCSYDREVRFPKGAWVHLWSGRLYGSTAGSTTATVQAPIGQPAVFYRSDWSGIGTLRARLASFGIAVP